MSDEVVEKPISDFPGWIKLQLGSSRRYRSPGGLEISAARFMQLSSKYRGQSYIPESEVLPPASSPKRGFISSPSSVKTKTKSDDEVDQNTALDYGEIATDIKPTQHKTSSKSKHPRASAAALALGFKKLLMIITAGIVAKLLNDGRGAMTEQEATVLGTALGNLLEPTRLNDEFGWLIAETGDWQAVGYILMTYLSRVNDVIQEKKHAQRPNDGLSGQSVPGPEPAQGNAAVGANGYQGRAGANLPYASTSPRWPPAPPLNGR